MRNRRSQFSAISMVLLQILIDFPSILIDFLLFSISFSQLQSILISFNQFDLVKNAQIYHNRKVRKITRNCKRGIWESDLYKLYQVNLSLPKNDKAVAVTTKISRHALPGDKMHRWICARMVFLALGFVELDRYLHASSGTQAGSFPAMIPQHHSRCLQADNDCEPSAMRCSQMFAAEESWPNCVLDCDVESVVGCCGGTFKVKLPRS